MGLIVLLLLLLAGSYFAGMHLDVRIPARVPAAFAVAGVLLAVMGLSTYKDDAPNGPFLWIGFFGGAALIGVAAVCAGVAIGAWQRRQSRSPDQRASE